MIKVVEKKGFSLIEMVVYVGILSILSALLIQSLFDTAQVSSEIKAISALNKSAVTAIERMILEIKNAESLANAGEFIPTANRLVLNTKDALGFTSTVEFYLVGQTLMVKEGAGSGVPITTGAVNVGSLSFLRIFNSETEGITLNLQMSATVRDRTASESFKNSAIIRRSYGN